MKMKMEEIPYDKLPLGFRFRPTDEQLINHYLKRKINGTIQPSESWVIPEIDVCRTEPWDLPSKWRVKSSDLEWFFFAAVDRKYPSGNRSNRATENGYWKATGKDRLIKSKKVLVGMKKTLVFHIGRAPRATGSCWIMHEYRVVNPDGTDVLGDEGTFVLCRLFKKDKDILKEDITPLRQASPNSDRSDDPHKINPENTYGQINEYNVANDEVLPYLVPTTMKPEQSHSNSDITTDAATHQGLRIKQEEDSLFDGLKDFLGPEYDQILSLEAPQNYTINPNLPEQQLCGINDLSTSDMAGTSSRDSDSFKPVWCSSGIPVHRAASKRSHRVPSEMYEPIEWATNFTSNDESSKASSSYENEINIRHRMPESSNNSVNYTSQQGTAERRIKLESVRHRKPKKQVEIEPPMATSVDSDQNSFSSSNDGGSDTNDLKVESPTSGCSVVPMHKIAVAVLVIVTMLSAGTMWLLTY